MRKYVFILSLMICLILTGAAQTRAESSSSRIILYTYYRQMGWGDRVQIGWVDDSGAVRTLDGHDSGLKWPYRPEEQLEYLSEKENLTAGYTLKHDDLFSMKSLIYSVEDQGSSSVPAANDAGTEKSFAVRYSKEGEPEFVLLGMSGDDLFENTDPNAQALYRILRVLFSGVTSYAYDSLGMGPQGFIPVPFSEFTGLDEDIVAKSEIKGFLSDCEEGPIPLELTEEDKAELVSLIRNGIVTGKADCILSTGGFDVYVFYDPAGNYIGEAAFEDGLLIMNDGRYYYEIREQN